jgi:acetyl esterase/lipase
MLTGGFRCNNRQDLLLDELANRTQLAVVSVDYRLAPEHPFPAANHDCHDVADWLVDNAPSKVCVWDWKHLFWALCAFVP